MSASKNIPDARGANLYQSDPTWARLLALYLDPSLMQVLTPKLEQLGALAGDSLDRLADTADKHPPTLITRSRTGVDDQRIDKHPAYVEMERLAFTEFGLAAISHRDDMFGWHGAMPPLAKYALTYVFVQSEFGLCCPVSMTDSLTRTLKKFGDPALVERYLPHLTTLDFEDLYQGAMFMTEQAAGSDIAATETMAYAQDDGTWRLHGDKWFCSNADAELAMVLARTENGQPGLKGVSLFLLPKTLDDGQHNHYRILRLKDKLGTRSMASGEIKLEGAVAYLVGEPGRGFVQMADMVNNSRLSNGVRAAGLMRRAVFEAEYVAHHRLAFGKRLADMSLMQRQLDKLRVPAEQARSMVCQTAQALRRSDAGEAGAYALLRILTPLIKFRACRDARKVTGDGMEVRGGCGYIEEWIEPRLVRDSHLGSIWEGTSNIVALDVIRAIRREGALPALQQQGEALLSACSADETTRALEHSLSRACALADYVTQTGDDAQARSVASALYHCFSACAMYWEATQTNDEERARLARLVLKHRLQPRDPLAGDTELETPKETAGAA
ncbi:acyl-CoA dehydrogenase family protein [Bordetella sp. 02P26C-1]|uniref:acyl-CoA dehydrogenase family protein n=1 Tax=Bordetella sp. 02P26C-1 TaxID=2683195 RepID=UPI001353CDF0|nr:acyl-CoA dehydrogenase family protein [Bordetella sp. 02P26C-1]MVW80857.1 DNA alkylation response protein [Bordetella sp. 02P26C-1]